MAVAPDTDELLRRVGSGDDSARRHLLTRHRDRLKRMVAVRLDPRVAARVDPSDVVQEALLDAAGRLSDYANSRPVPFYPWLRRLAWEHLVKLHEKHLHARKRTVKREAAGGLALPEGSSMLLAERVAASSTGPSRRLVRAELQQRVRTALDKLSPTDREVLVLRYLEQMPTAEIASVLGLGESAVKMRHSRALDRLLGQLGDDVEL